MKRLVGIWDIIGLLITICSLLCTFVNVVILLDYARNTDEMPSFFGWQLFIVMSDSMSPVIKEKDFILVKEFGRDSFHNNDVVSVKYDKQYIMARINGIADNEVAITLDNGSFDENVPTAGVIGKYIMTIPYLGEIILFIQEPIHFTIIMIILTVIYLTIVFIERKRDKDGKINLKKKGGEK